MPHSDKRPDGLSRWAADRAPAILAQAEKEAVAVLRDALLAGAMGQRDRGVLPQSADHLRAPAVQAPVPSAGEPALGELLWTYCVLRASDPHPRDLLGVDGAGPVEREEADGVAALVSRVPRAEFGADALRRNLNDLGWLERVARRHEAVIERALATSTIVPLRMCTLYESGDSVRRMLERERTALQRALELLDGRREWAVKVLVDRERVLEAARARSGDASSLEREFETLGEGGAYMLRRRVDRETRELAEALTTEVADGVHSRLQDWAIDALRLPRQNRELSGHEGEMLLNAAYLVDADRSDELRRLISELEAHHGDLGARIELTGPWPPYNFVPGGDVVTLG